MDSITERTKNLNPPCVREGPVIEGHVQRWLPAILVAEVVGYSRLIEQNAEDRRARLRSLHAEVIDPRITTDGGRVVKTTIDGILVEFGGVARRSPKNVSGRRQRR